MFPRQDAIRLSCAELSSGVRQSWGERLVCFKAHDDCSPGSFFQNRDPRKRRLAHMTVTDLARFLGLSIS